MPGVTIEPSAVHPAKAVLVLRGITIRSAAAAIGVSELTLGRQLNRWERPTPRVRAGLAALLSLPESELFDEVTWDRRAS